MTEYAYQAIIWPKGGGAPLKDTVFPLPTGVDPSTLRALFERMFGEVQETAYTVEDDKRLNIGWVFNAPDNVKVAADAGEVELVIIPLLVDPENGEYVTMFGYQARMKAAFLAASAALDVPVTVITSGDGEDDEREPAGRLPNG